MGDLSDSNFVKQAREGNKQAYDYLVRKYQFRIIKLVRQYVSTQETAEDIAQEAFVKAYYGLQNFREESKFYTWLYKIAINTAKNHLGKEKKRAREYSVLIEEVENSNVVAYVRHSDTPDHEMQATELEAAINDALAKMPEELRVAITLRELEGFDYERIAKIMNCPVGTVRSRIFRARESLDEVLKKIV
ncbi:MAG: sigma-70 family RNA polymerase sigma factor [Pseudomonadota bacterium]